MGIQALAEKRLPLYETWCNCAIQMEAKPELTAARIREAVG